MTGSKLPLYDETPWGSDERRDREYVNELMERWSDGMNESAFLLDTLEFKKKGRILDLGCGVGRHSIAFAHDGCVVTGIDINMHAIKKAKEICEKKGIDASFICMDFRRIPYENEFDMITLLDNTFGLYTDEDNLQFLKKIEKALVSGGYLVIDAINREYVIQRLSLSNGIGRTWKEKNGMLFYQVSSFDLLRSRYNSWNQYMIIKTGEKGDEYTGSLRLYTLFEMTSLLKSASLEMFKYAGGYNGSDYSLTSERMISIIRKP